MQSDRVSPNRIQTQGERTRFFGRIWHPETAEKLKLWSKQQENRKGGEVEGGAVGAGSEIKVPKLRPIFRFGSQLPWSSRTIFQREAGKKINNKIKKAISI